jgi:transposase-like protein
MAERNLSVDHVTIWRWVQRYAPVLNQRIRRELRRPNRSWRVDETYIKVAGNWVYLYRTVDSTGETIEFMLSPKRDLIAAKLFLRLALSGGGPRPRVINVDGHPAYASAIAELKQTVNSVDDVAAAPRLTSTTSSSRTIGSSRSASRRASGFDPLRERAGRSKVTKRCMQSAKDKSDGSPRVILWRSVPSSTQFLEWPPKL